ncbi:Tad domain-containing protein [Roseomonas sp. HJA6]|uniref:Tad domain-containing protein n=1 Tax=Roseomonas alba TaxID=2846776 RepID=A0ABS7AFE7_9PROT|nr:Tad domain-containing protein [Neoroseomonas alba]
MAVVGFAGLAIDLSRIWMLSARLKTAVDAASLNAARTMTSTTVDETSTRQLFWANFNQNGWSNRFLGSTVPTTPAQPVIQRLSDTRIRLTATATLDTTLFGIISRQTTPLAETTVAEREATGLELAVVMDQTSSMRGSKLAAAQAAVGTMLATLYGSDDTKRNLFVSVVPFARTINIGPGNANFLNTTSMPGGWDLARWNGCVESRGGGQDITDIGPTTSAGQLRPYFYASTFRRVGWATVTGSPASPSNTVATLARNATLWANATGVPQYRGGGTSNSGTGVCTTANAYGAITVALYASDTANSTTNYRVAFCRGDNDWNSTVTLSTNSGNANYNAEYADRISQGLEAGMANDSTVAAAGRNTLCAQSPILPLTASRATVQAAVNAITAPIKSGGTTIVAGMQGAWYTLSPEWRNWWPGSAVSPNLGVLPLAYNTRNMFKAVVILTDGDNNWQAAYAGNSVRGSPANSELLYNAYGRINPDSRPPDTVTNWNTMFPSSQITSVTQTNADAALDTRFAAICRAMKNPDSTLANSDNPNNHRIRIYVIGFEVANSTQRTMLQNCASTPNSPYYFEAPSASDLQRAFTEIANSLSSLRLVE